MLDFKIRPHVIVMVNVDAVLLACSSRPGKLKAGTGKHVATASIRK